LGKSLKGKDLGRGIDQKKDGRYRVWFRDGMQPKVLQKLSGHKSLKTTMDRYVLLTEDSMDDAIRNFEKCQITTLGGSKIGTNHLLAE